MVPRRALVAATAGWMLIRLHADAFLAVGGASRTIGVQGLHRSSEATSCTWLPCISTPPSLSSAPPGGVDTAVFGGPSRRSSFLYVSTGDNSIESSVVAPGEQEHSVLDALIEQFTSPKDGNTTASVEEYLDLCDHALLTRLRGRIESSDVQSPVVRTLSRTCAVFFLDNHTVERSKTSPSMVNE